MELDHSNILRRIQKYSTTIDQYIKTLKPEVADIWHHDEIKIPTTASGGVFLMFAGDGKHITNKSPQGAGYQPSKQMKIQAGGKWKWLWNIMDEETKFLITTQVSTKAKVADSRRFFGQAVEQTDRQPAFLITNVRHPLTRSIQKEMPETQHVRLVSLTDKRTNNQGIERLNGTVSNRVKTMRGFDSLQSAELMTSAYRNCYNFIKPHSALSGMTPALKAGVGIGLEGNRWMALLKKSMEQ